MKIAKAGDLSNVFFIGGPMCSGKSSAAEYLAKKYSVNVYHADAAHNEHIKHISAKKFPYLYSVRHRPWSQAFLKLPRWLLGDLLKIYQEEIVMAVDDLRKYPRNKIIIAEGTVFTPQLIHNFAKPSQSVFLIATESFQFAHGMIRGDWVKEILSQYHDPDKAYRRWMKRDAMFARYIKRGSQRYHYRSIDITGKLDIKKIEQMVEAHLRTFLGDTET